MTSLSSSSLGAAAGDPLATVGVAAAASNATTAAAGEEASDVKFCALDNPECEACQ